MIKIKNCDIESRHSNHAKNRVYVLFIFLLINIHVIFLNANKAIAKLDFTSSNLPLIFIDTQGQQIRNSRRIIATMGIIDNGAGQRNNISDQFNNYNGRIAIELRGSSGLWQQWPKQMYGFETQENEGNNNNVSLLGLPNENDWILYAPYSDKSLIRNVIIYGLSNDIGRYAPRTRFCELFLNNDYRGVYVLIEKIKRDKNRVDIATLRPEDITGDQLTGGYIVKVDRRAGEENDGWDSPHQFSSKGKVEWLFHDPGPDELTVEQKEYIKYFIIDFEDKMNTRNWKNYFDEYFNIYAYIDYYLLNEFSKNVDTWTFSTFFYKDRDSKRGKLTIGPIWDYNLAFGNVNYFVGMETEGWLLEEKILTKDRIPFWLEKVYKDPDIKSQIVERWQELKQNQFDLNRILQKIDNYVGILDESQKRNFERWPILGNYIWPNYYIGESYRDEINYLKGWIVDRWKWMDNELEKTVLVGQSFSSEYHEFVRCYPNPFNTGITVSMSIEQDCFASIRIVNLKGQPIKTLYDQKLSAGAHNFYWQGLTNTGLSASSGLYFYIADIDNKRTVGKINLVR